MVNGTNTLTHATSFDLYLNFTVRSVDGKWPKGPPLNSSQMGARLHFVNGKILDPKPDDRHGGVGVGNSRAVNYSFIYEFPWSRNALDEAWLEVTVLGQTYWLEVPYGFTRNPTEPIESGSRQNGKPSFAPGMVESSKTNQIIHWTRVHYDMGRIQNNWGLDLFLSNPSEANAEIVLYREDMRIGKSMFLWDLHSPRTSFAIKAPDRVIGSMAMGVRLHGDGLRRSDTFLANRDPNDERCWGTAIIKVDSKNYECVVPSSLFEFMHGHLNTGP